MNQRRSSLFALVVGVALAVSAGCLVRSAPPRGQSHHDGAHGSHHHCHDRGGKHRKRKCHAHPHRGGHH